MIRAGIIGDYDPTYINHINTERSLQHAAQRLGLTVESTWLITDEIRMEDLPEYDLLWCAPGSPYKSLENTLTAIWYARQGDVPFLGTCGGFQHVVLEYARNVLKLSDAHHGEYDHESQTLLITPLECSVVGQTLEVMVSEGTLAYGCYGETLIREQYHCRYGLNPEYRKLFDGTGLVISGLDSNDEVRIVEIPENKFFIASLFLPQSLSTEDNPHPLILNLVKAAEVFANQKAEA